MFTSTLLLGRLTIVLHRPFVYPKHQQVLRLLGVYLCVPIKSCCNHGNLPVCVQGQGAREMSASGCARVSDLLFHFLLFHFSKPTWRGKPEVMKQLIRLKHS